MRGYIFDLLFLVLFLTVTFFALVFAYYVVSKVGSLFPNNEVFQSVQSGFAFFDANFPFLFAAILLTVVGMVLVLAVRPHMAFLFGIVWLFVGLLLGQLQDFLVVAVAKFAPTLPNFGAILLNLDKFFLVTGFVMTAFGFLRGIKSGGSP